MTLPEGTRFGPYEVLAPLGAGGMGEVYRARDNRLGREVAIKLLPERYAENPDLRSRFEREARTVASINHPNILSIHDVGEAGGRLFIVTELVPGESLRQWIPSGGAGWRRAAQIGASIAAGLAAAHARGIVHRDVKPENVVMTRDGHVKVLDFGLARSEGASLSSDMSRAPTLSPPTEPGVVLGTVGYMSPEQVRGMSCDARADVFALGCVLFEVATGERAFSGPSAADTISQILRAAPAERLEARDDVPSGFCRIVAQCLEKDPGNRFQSMHDLAFSLSLVSEPGTARPTRTREAIEAAPRADSGGAASVAVLPFSNRSPDPENEYFSDGMTEELIGALSRVPGLRVASRTSVFALKGRSQDVRALGRELGATAILEGSVRRAGDRLRVTAQLTDVADGYHLWSDSFDGEVGDVIAVQDEIARRIVSVLGQRLGFPAATPIPRRHDTPNIHALQLYWKGRHLWNKRTPESRLRAIKLFEEAITADPGYARAYAGLADCFLERGGLSLPIHTIVAKARNAALKALEIDDTLADPHTSLGRVHLYYDWNWPAAEAELRRAIELDPQYAEGHHTYSHYLLPAGRVAESLSESERALELEPLDLGMNTHLGWHHLYSGDFDRAIEQCRFAAEMDPAFFYARFYLGMALEQSGRLDEALAEFEEAVKLSPESAEAEAGRIHALALLGRGDDAEAALANLERRPASSIAFETTVALVGLARTAEALGHLRAALAERPERMVDLTIDPRLRPLHPDAEFQSIARRVGIPA